MVVVLSRRVVLKAAAAVGVAPLLSRRKPPRPGTAVNAAVSVNAAVAVN